MTSNEQWTGIETLAQQRNEALAKVEQLRGALLQAKHSHRVCEDPWYSCPKSEDGCANKNETECNCGADHANAAIDAALTDALLEIVWDKDPENPKNQCVSSTQETGLTPLDALLVEWWSTDMDHTELFNRAVRLNPSLASAMQSLPEKTLTPDEVLARPVAWRQLVDSPYERHPRWHYTEERPTEEPERFEALYVQSAPLECRVETGPSHEGLADTQAARSSAADPDAEAKCCFRACLEPPIARIDWGLICYTHSFRRAGIEDSAAQAHDRRGAERLLAAVRGEPIPPLLAKKPPCACGTDKPGAHAADRCTIIAVVS